MSLVQIMCYADASVGGRYPPAAVCHAGSGFSGHGDAKSFVQHGGAAQNSMLEGCPVFIDRLRRSPELAQRVKELMRNWGQQEETK
jgi:hypothetical protein